MPEQSNAAHPAVLHVLDTLPDSLRLRKLLLEDCLILLPESDPLAIRISHMLELLILHEQLQQELPLRTV